jgi:hypothetical protein
MSTSKLVRVISGGQTGADKTALLCARAIGLETGGTAPKGWKIDGGTDPSLADYGLIESDSSDYAVRTRNNVEDADVTIWIGKVGSPGYWCTKNATQRYSKPFFVNPSDVELEYICNTYAVANFAGNRARINKDVVWMTEQAFKAIANILDKAAPNFGSTAAGG